MKRHVWIVAAGLILTGLMFLLPPAWPQMALNPETLFPVWLGDLCRAACASVHYAQKTVYLSPHIWEDGRGWNARVPAGWHERAIESLVCYFRLQRGENHSPGWMDAGFTSDGVRDGLPGMGTAATSRSDGPSAAASRC